MVIGLWLLVEIYQLLNKKSLAENDGNQYIIGCGVGGRVAISSSYEYFSRRGRLAPINAVLDLIIRHSSEKQIVHCADHTGDRYKGTQSFLLFRLMFTPITAVRLKNPMKPDLWGSRMEAFCYLMYAVVQMIIRMMIIIPCKSKRAD
jgi:hypothetical protein